MLKVVKKRRSIRSYLSKPVEEEKVKAILTSVMFSPSANHLRPWELVVVKDKELIKKLSSATAWGSFAAGAPVVIVVCADVNLSENWLEDASIVGAHIYLEVTNQGLGTCWVQIKGYQAGDGQDSEKCVRKLLNIPDRFRVLSLFPIGYPAKELPEHSESEFDQSKIHTNQW